MSPWYKEGLRFQCTECGACCTGSPGYVWVSLEEIDQIAETLKISKEEFIKKFTRQVGSRLALLENPHNFDCVFLKERRCTIYSKRPRQCRTFPWWKENLKSPESWKEAATYCEGINKKEAPLISLGEIQKQGEMD